VQVLDVKRPARWRSRLAATLVVALPGCGLFFRTVDRSEREGAARLFPATAADVFFLGEIPVLAPFLLLDLPISLAFDLVLLPVTALHVLNERPPRAASPPARRVAPAPTAVERVERVEEAPPVVPDVDPPQLRLGSGQTD
jgi:hypothetical protein